MHGYRFRPIEDTPIMSHHFIHPGLGKWCVVYPNVESHTNDIACEDVVEFLDTISKISLDKPKTLC